MDLLHLYGYILLPCNHEIEHELSASSMPRSSLDVENTVKYKHTHTHMHTGTFLEFACCLEETYSKHSK